MKPAPDWLPAMLELAGTWNTILKLLYSVFEEDFKNHKTKFRHAPVMWDTRVLQGNDCEECFLHLTTREVPEHGRVPDFPRCKRLPWCRPTIEHADIEDVKTWDYREAKRTVRTYLWLQDLDYCVVLERKAHDNRERFFLVTAFHVDGPSRRRNLGKKYAQRCDEQ